MDFMKRFSYMLPSSLLPSLSDQSLSSFPLPSIPFSAKYFLLSFSSIHSLPLRSISSLMVFVMG